MASILGHRGIPHYSEYCASKFALVGFSESLRAELADQGIDVLIVSPGTTQSEFFEFARSRASRRRQPRRRGRPARGGCRRDRARAIRRADT